MLCRYWQLGKLVPVEDAEAAERREAAARARDYGAQANERAKALCARKGSRHALPPGTKARPPDPSKTQRARAFAQTIKRPSVTSGRPRPGAKTDAAAGQPPPQPPPRRTVSRLLERHESAAQHVDKIREDLARWDLDSQERAREPKLHLPAKHHSSRDHHAKARAAGKTRQRQEGAADVRALERSVEEAGELVGGARDLPSDSPLADPQPASIEKSVIEVP
jgi:hypothetical protein